MSTAQPSKNPGVKAGPPQSAQQVTHKANTYVNRGVQQKPRGMGC